MSIEPTGFDGKLCSAEEEEGGGGGVRAVMKVS